MKKTEESTNMQKKDDGIDAAEFRQDSKNISETGKAGAGNEEDKETTEKQDAESEEMAKEAGTENEENKEMTEEAGAESEKKSGTEDGEKLLFRDTTPELVESAVYSLNCQGLASVQCRKEEETYAVYASEEEFERARELLIEILKDEAENIRERARTLEAKKKLREMETTELAPGFRPQKTPKEKYEDANSTAIAFLVVGVCGIIFVVLEYFGIFFSLGLSENVSYIFYPTMLIMFAAFLIVGFVSMNQAAKWKIKMFDEKRMMNNVREYAEHELIHEIQTLMAERVLNEANMTEETAASDMRPNPEDALSQLANMMEDAEENESEEEKDDAAFALEETGETGMPEQSIGTAADQTDEFDGDTETPEESDREEMEHVFNDYYVMEQEIQLRLLKEFPDLSAGLLLEATEYVIQLMEENHEQEEAADTEAEEE